MSAASSRRLLDSLPDAVLVVDGSGVVRFANQVALQTFGESVVGAVVGLPVRDFAVVEVPRPDRLLTVEMRVAAAEDWGSAAKAIVLRDVTEREELKQELRGRVEELSGLVDLLRVMPVPTARVDCGGTIRWRNTAFAEAFGAAGDLDVVMPCGRQSLGDLLSARGDAEAVRSAVAEMGGEAPVLVTSVPLAARAGNPEFGVVVHTAKSTDLLAEYVQVAYYDRDLGVPNRRGLALRLNGALAQGLPVGLLALRLVGLDDGDAVAAGRRALGVAQSVVAALAPPGRPGEAQALHIARTAPAELVLALVGDAGSGPWVAQAVTRTAEGIVRGSMDRTYVGLLSSADKAAGAEEAIGWAMAAADLAADRHEPVHAYSVEDDEEVHRQRRLADELRRAIVAREFVPVFQPRIDLKSGRLASAEVLARWLHPERGLRPPGEFLPVLRRLDLVPELTRVIAWKTMELVRSWVARGRRPVKLSVNVVPSDLTAPATLQALRDLAALGTPATTLELELSEADIFAGPDHERLREILDCVGVELSLDDFGSGYSTFSYLVRLPISCIKVDKSFADELLVPSRRAAAAALYRSIVALGRELRIVVCAEGVETQPQVDELRLLGVDQIQGYVFSTPLSAEEFEGRYLR